MIDLNILTNEFCAKHGASQWGYTEEDQPKSFLKFKKWKDEGQAAPLTYLEDERGDKRSSLTSVYPEFQSAVSFIFPYTPKDYDGPFKMGHYIFAYGGEDYHFVLRERLTAMAKEIAGNADDFKIILDVEPVLERDLAYRSGLGWFGKNSMLINRKYGSYFLIGSILFNKKAKNYDNEGIRVDHCGNCTACIDECPTLAINPETRTIVVDKCISTFTIELFKEATPPEAKSESTEIFGCDICQDVCPWNIKLLKKSERLEGGRSKEIEAFFFTRPLQEVVDELENMSNRAFKRKFERSSLERTGRVGVLKNLKPFL